LVRMHTPEQCESLAQVRAEIDRLDALIVPLLAERGGYVLAAARFKQSAEEVPAAQHGALPEVVERVYRTMIAAFIDAELQHWRQR
jgi:isochorismate pyruvate lyase